MANFIIVDTGKYDFLNTYLSAGYNLVCGIYTNSSLTWTHSTLYSTLTQPTWTGYSTLSLLSWSTPVADASFDYYSNPIPVTFTNPDATTVTVYGSFIYNASNTTLIGGGNFTTAVTLSTGMSITVPITLQDQSQY